MGSAAGGLLVLLIFFAMFALAEYFRPAPQTGALTAEDQPHLGLDSTEPGRRPVRPWEYRHTPRRRPLERRNRESR
jgi:hypothetical protein